jgi:hypothetical protein
MSALRPAAITGNALPSARIDFHRREEPGARCFCERREDMGKFWIPYDDARFGIADDVIQLSRWMRDCEWDGDAACTPDAPLHDDVLETGWDGDATRDSLRSVDPASRRVAMRCDVSSRSR